MEANRSRRRWTYTEYARLPMSSTTRYEVIDDELALTPSPTTKHQIVVANLLLTLGTFVHEHALGLVLPGPVDVLFGEGDYVQPDLVFLQTDRLHLMRDRGIEGPPDLVVEILSPSTAGRDRGVKLERYRHFGVSEYWIVDHEARTIEVWQLGAGAGAAHILRDGEAFAWTPVVGGPTLEVGVAGIVA
ncbi:MAG: Uma2 family endonuclease [Gemmatimonadota bacterium]